MMKAAFERNELPDVRYCKVGACENGQECSTKDSFMICRDCSGRTCLNCNTEMHAGLTCAEIAEQKTDTEEQVREQEAQTKEALKQLNTKHCPNTKCGITTQKIDGCDHMLCTYRSFSKTCIGTNVDVAVGSQCGHGYCWSCLAAYDPILEFGNKSHERSCPHYA